jgi:hypothetical protein
METFTNIYNKYIAQSLILYEIDKRRINDHTISHIVELEFNEERGIEIELHLNKGDVLDMFNIFNQIVCDARFAYYNKKSENYQDFQDYMECNLGAKKLCFLVGEDIYNKLINCEIDNKA